MKVLAECTGTSCASSMLNCYPYLENKGAVLRISLSGDAASTPAVRKLWGYVGRTICRTRGEVKIESVEQQRLTDNAAAGIGRKVLGERGLAFIWLIRHHWGRVRIGDMYSCLFRARVLWETLFKAWGEFCIHLYATTFIWLFHGGLDVNWTPQSL